MKAWSDRPFASVVDAKDVSDRTAVIAENGGEASVIYEIKGHPGWLAKNYKAPLLAERVSALERLIELPASMPGEDRALVDRCTAWPVSRIEDNNSGTVGVIIAKAPDQFFAEVPTIKGRVRRIGVTLDHLALPEDRLRQLGLPVPTLLERVSLIRAIVAVGDLLQRYGLVYGDWSYSNAFWSSSTLQVLVIDVDSCGYISRPWITTNAWEDPLSGQGIGLTSYTDRYKLSVLAVRCLTGVRTDDESALAAIPAVLRGGQLDLLLQDSLGATRTTARPSLPELLRALDQAAEQCAANQPTETIRGNVVGWQGLRRAAPVEPARPQPLEPDNPAPVNPGAQQPLPGVLPSGSDQTPIAGSNVIRWRQMPSAARQYPPSQSRPKQRPMPTPPVSPEPPTTQPISSDHASRRPADNKVQAATPRSPTWQAGALSRSGVASRSRQREAIAAVCALALISVIVLILVIFGVL